MKTIIDALRPHYSDPGSSPPGKLVCYSLGDSYTDELLKKGLHQVFIPGFGVLFVYDKPVWFALTSHGCYWTPSDIKSGKEDVNWTSVSQKDITGKEYYYTPDSEVVQIIEWLQQKSSDKL